MVIILKINKTIDPIIIKEPAVNLFKTLGKVIKEISFLGKGEGSAIFKIVTQDSTYCLKTALYPERTQKILNEVKIRNYFIEKGLQFVPAPKHSDKEFFRNGAVIYDFVEGNLSVFDNENIIKKMAHNLAEIHKLDYKIKINGLEHMMMNHQFLMSTINRLETNYSYLVNPSISKAFTQALTEYENIILENKSLFLYGISGILHGDLSDNFITDPQGKIWLVDWENSEYGDILDEICTFVYDNDIEGDLRKLFFNEYKIHFTPASQLDLEKIGLFYICVMPVFNLCWG